MPQVMPPALSSLLSADNALQRDSAWAAFLLEYNNLILHICHKFDGGYDDAMDRYAFVIEKLRNNEFRALRSYDPQGTGKFTTWFTIVVRRLCLDERRARYGRQQATGRSADEGQRVRRDLAKLVATEIDTVQIADPGAQPDALAVAAEQTSILAVALNVLSPEDRLILRLRFEQDLSVPEIAKLINAESPFHLYRRLDKIFAALRADLRRAGAGEFIG